MTELTSENLHYHFHHLDPHLSLCFAPPKPKKDLAFKATCVSQRQQQNKKHLEDAVIQVMRNWVSG